MNLHSIINPHDFGGISLSVGPAGVPESSQAAQHAAVKDTRRSARVHIRPNKALAPSADRKIARPSKLLPAPDKRRPKGGTKPTGRWSAKPPQAGPTAVPALAPNSLPQRRRARRAAKASTPRRSSTSSSGQSAKEACMRAQAVADLYTVSRGHLVSIMDVVLDSRESATVQSGIDDDWMDSIEERQRLALHDPSDDEMMLEIFNPWWYGARLARKWQGTVVTPVDCSSSRIYHVSAERSTAAWDSSLDSNDIADTLELDSYATA